MTNFSNLDRLRVTADRTVRYVLTQIPWHPAPVLIVSHAGEPNKGYWAAFLRQSTSKGRARQISTGKITPELIEETRETFRTLFPIHIVKGWENIVDANGNPVEYSPQACAEFLKALPPPIFDDVSNFCIQYANFIDEDMPTEQQVDELAGN